MVLRLWRMSMIQMKQGMRRRLTNMKNLKILPPNSHQNEKRELA